MDTPIGFAAVIPPTQAPSIAVTPAPSNVPSNAPTNTPSIAPSIAPSMAPSMAPASSPAGGIESARIPPLPPVGAPPTNSPTHAPTILTHAPTPSPTALVVASLSPTPAPSLPVPHTINPPAPPLDAGTPAAPSVMVGAKAPVTAAMEPTMAEFPTGVNSVLPTSETSASPVAISTAPIGQQQIPTQLPATQPPSPTQHVSSNSPTSLAVNSPIPSAVQPTAVQSVPTISSSPAPTTAVPTFSQLTPTSDNANVPTTAIQPTSVPTFSQITPTSGNTNAPTTAAPMQFANVTWWMKNQSRQYTQQDIVDLILARALSAATRYVLQECQSSSHVCQPGAWLQVKRDAVEDFQSVPDNVALWTASIYGMISLAILSVEFSIFL
jgi:hypothetical protein